MPDLEPTPRRQFSLSSRPEGPPYDVVSIAVRSAESRSSDPSVGLPGPPSGLLARLVEAKLAGTRDDSGSFGYAFRTNEQAAALAYGIVRAYLLEEGLIDLSARRAADPI